MAVSLRKPIQTDWDRQLDRLEKWPTVPGSEMDRRRNEQVRFLRRAIQLDRFASMLDPVSA